MPTAIPAVIKITKTAKRLFLKRNCLNFKFLRDNTFPFCISSPPASKKIICEAWTRYAKKEQNNILMPQDYKAQNVDLNGCYVNNFSNTDLFAPQNDKENITG